MKTLSLLVIINLITFLLAPDRNPPLLPDLMPDTASSELISLIKDTYNSNLGTSRKFLDLGDQLLAEGYFSHASICYQRSIQSDKNNYPAFMGLAVCYEVLGHKDNAVINFLHVSSLTNDAGIVHSCTIRAGILLLRIGNVAKALHLFETVDDPASFYYLCRIHTKLGNRAKAKKYFDLLLEYDQNNLMAELYQLNALSNRTFGSSFRELPDSTHRELLFSENVPLEIRKAIARYTSGLSPNQKYASVINNLPYIVHDTKHFTEEEIAHYIFDKSSITRGGDLFKQRNCIICHGVNGGGFNGPNLSDDYWIIDPVSASSIYNTILNGRANNTMPSHEHLLRPEEIRDITAFVIYTNIKTHKDKIGTSQFGKAPQGTFQPLSNIYFSNE